MESNNIDLEIHQEAGQLLLDYYRHKIDKVDPLEIKAAMSGYNGSTRAMSTARVRDAMQLAVLKELVTDKSQLAEYIKATLPDYVPHKL